MNIDLKIILEENLEYDMIRKVRGTALCDIVTRCHFFHHLIHNQVWNPVESQVYRPFCLYIDDQLRAQIKHENTFSGFGH